jgi:hypothetical protein
MLQKLFKVVEKNGQTHISWMKVGSLVFTVLGGIIISGVCPPAILPYLKIIIGVGAAIGFVGARDAMKQ